MKTLLQLIGFVGLLLGGLVHVTAQTDPPNDPPGAAALKLFAPVEGEQFVQGVPITLKAIAVQPHAAVLRVEFFADGQRVGVSEVVPVPPVPPGHPVVHEFVWKDATLGKHKLFARASDGTDLGAQSQTVVIEVVELRHRSLIQIIAPKDTSEFQVGDDVNITAEATDSAGLIGPVDFFANGDFIGSAQFDPCPPCLDPPWCPLRPCFLPGPGTTLTHSFNWKAPSAGKYALEVRGTNVAGEIVSSSSVRIVMLPPAGPLLRFAGPLSGETFRTSRLVPLEVTAVDPLSEIRRVEFYAGDKSLGVSEILTKEATIPGRPRLHHLIWTNPPAGDFKLHARAKTDGGIALESEGVLVHILGDGKNDPSVVLTAPVEGATFKVPGTIHVEATAVHPALGIVSIQFFANGEFIGQMRYCCDFCPCAVPLPGRPFIGGIEWADAKPGDYAITARAVAFGDVTFESAPIKIHITGDEPKSRLTITQPGDGTVLRDDQPSRIVAVGLGRFGGITDVELLLDGKRAAESHITFIRPPGADEPVTHEFSVTVPIGAHELVVRDLTDSKVVSPTVHVKTLDSNLPATLTWVQPADGAKFAFGKPIVLELEAIDPKGLIYHVDLFADDHLIGVSDFVCLTCKFAPGALIPHRFEWQGAAVGKHVLHAAAKDSAGHEVLSKRLAIEVTAPPPPLIIAERTLPAFFQPGAKFTVSVAVKPAEGVQNYVVAEHPPFVRIGGAPPPPDFPQWSVTAISEGGVFDAASGAVKFGPFFDHQSRVLTYELTPNLAPVESASFDGEAVADGSAVKVGGDLTLLVSLRHPADRDPADNSINAVELTTYGAVWKSGQEWAGATIPMDYVTRAGALWREGEHYRFDPTANGSPMCWISDPFLPPVAPPGKPRFHGVALRSVKAATGQPKEITVRILPAPEGVMSAVEEQVAGTPSAISEGGKYDSATKTIRWGPFLDRQPHTVSYRLAGADARQTERGAVSFDGASIAVATSPQASPVSGPQLVSLSKLADGAMQLVLEDAAFTTTAGYDLETSADLKHWTRVGSFVIAPAGGFIRDESPSINGPRFYRAVRVK